MAPIHFPSKCARHPALRTLSALVATAAVMAACGGGGSSTSADPAAADEFDQADAATLAQVTELLDTTDASLRALGLPTAADRTQAGGQQASLQPVDGHGWYPGLSQTNLVSNRIEFEPEIVEPEMKNAWGIAIRPAGLGGHFWVGAAGTGKSLQFVGDVGETRLFQDDLAVVNTAGATTGVAFNPGAGFVIDQPHANGNIVAPAKFFFANASGSITAWTERVRPEGGVDQPLDSVMVVDGLARHSSFLGVTVAPAADRMLAADFGADAQLRAYDSAFAEQAAWTNPFRPQGQKQPGGFEAFNVQTLGESVFAMYGRQVAPEPGTLPPADGRLVEFNGQGKVIARWPGRGYLNYPWGVARAPQDFGLYGGCLLVGNFGDGHVVAFHPRLKVALDYVRDTNGKPVVIDGLWGLQFGNGESLGEANHLYFAAGPNQEADGLFGKLRANPNTLPYVKGLSLCR